MSKLGTELFFYLQDVPENSTNSNLNESFKQHFMDVLASQTNQDRVFKTPASHVYPNGFLRVVGGDVEMSNCTIKYAISERGLIIISENSKLTIKQNKISSLIGFQ